jgi:halimadienyl-diphosphate synthase
VRDIKALWDKGKGVGHSSSHSVPNADDSALAFAVLRLAGLDPDPDPLYQFEREDYFICYSFERDPSTSANIHVLEALKGVDELRVRKAVNWLRSVQVDGGYWMDKWHASPYYPTAHAVIALIGIDHDLAQSAIQWILDTQRPDGCWGHYDSSTAEETAYCLQALSIYDRYVESVDKGAIAQGRQGLLACRDEMPALWIGKCLYTPVRVVESAICSALAMTGA